MEQSKYQHSDKLPLSLVVEELEKETALTEKALHILSVEDRDNTYRPDGAVSALINHWLCERDLNCYINGKLVEDFTALTVLPVDGDYGKGMDALENWITIRKDELAALLEQRNLTVPAFLRPSVQASKAPTAGKVGTNRKTWDDAKLRALLDEYNQPGVTQEGLADKHGVKRQRIGSLLKDAKAKFKLGNAAGYGQLLNPRIIKGKF